MTPPPDDTVPGLRESSLVTLRSFRAGLALAVALGLTLCAVPLFGTLGPESALALGVFLPPWAALFGARAAHHARGRDLPSSVLLSRVVGHTCVVVALATGFVALNCLRIKTCEPLHGLAFIALGPLAGACLASVVGVALGTCTRRHRIAAGLAFLIPLVGIGRALYDFVATPGIFAFGHFFGYFPGTFYDREVDIPAAWLSQRALDLLVAVALWSLVVALRDRNRGTFQLERGERQWAVLALVIASGWAAVLVERRALELGQRTSSAFVAAKLGLTIDSARCRMVLPREISTDAAERLARDCDFRVQQIERRLGVRETERITAFMFRSASEKRTLMGASRVYIAKPFRREVYLQLADFPHPVLAHELAHVVARHAARGPFGVAGKLGGLIPEPVLVEGLAVALDPTSRDELTPHQLAKAAKLAHVAPPLEALLGPSFLGHNQALAYTLAGSFLSHVLETRGQAVVRRIYDRGDVVAVLEQPFHVLEAEWERALSRVPLPPHAESLARARFSRPGVFSQVCPHTVERLGSELASALTAGDAGRAVDACRAVLDIDPADSSTRATLVGSLAVAGDAAGAKRELARLEGPLRTPATVLAHAREGLADALYAAGSFAEAAATYRKLLEQPLPESDLRQIEVKLLGLAAGNPARHWVMELLIGTPGRGVDTRSAMHAIREIWAARDDGLGPYLHARQLSAASRHELALPLFSEALVRGLATRRLRVEAERQRGISAFCSGQYALSEQSFLALAQVADASLAEKKESADWRERIAFQLKLR